MFPSEFQAYLRHVQQLSDISQPAVMEVSIWFVNSPPEGENGAVTAIISIAVPKFLSPDGELGPFVFESSLL